MKLKLSSLLLLFANKPYMDELWILAAAPICYTHSISGFGCNGSGRRETGLEKFDRGSSIDSQIIGMNKGGIEVPGLTEQVYR